MNWLLYGTIGILAIGIIVGYIKGALRIAVSLAAAVAAWILVVVLTPYAADAVIQYTPADDWIEERLESALMTNMSDALEEQAGIENGTDIDLPALAEQLSGGEISRQEQAQIIENSDVPEIFKEYLQENNNKEIYSMIGADSFADYIAKGITRLIIQILTAVVLFFVISAALKIVMYILDVVSWLPIIGGINRIAGAALGLVMALIFIWIVFLVFTLLYTIPAGEEIFAQINGNAFLRFLYQNNYILKILMGLR